MERQKGIKMEENPAAEVKWLVRSEITQPNFRKFRG